MLSDISRRLVMRYPVKRTFSFAKLRADASEESLMELANAFASVQSENPSRVTAVLTRKLI